MEEQVINCQQGHGSATTTVEGLASLIGQNSLSVGTFWVLLLERSTNRCVTLEGIDHIYEFNDEFHVVGGGDLALSHYFVAWAHLVSMVDKIMRKKAKSIYDDSNISRESAILGLPMYRLVGSEVVQLSGGGAAQGESFVPPLSSQEMQLLSTVLKTPSLLAPHHDDDTASSSMAIVSTGMENTSGFDHIALHRDPSYTAFVKRPRQVQIVSCLNLGGYLDSSHGLSPTRHTSISSPIGFPLDGLTITIIRSNLAGDGAGTGGHSLLGNLAARHVITGSLGVHAEREFSHRRWRDSDLEEGGGAAPAQQPSEEVAKMLKDIFCQAYAALLPACAMAYPVLKDAPNHVMIIIFGGLVFIYIVVIAGILSKSLACRQLAFRAASCSAVTLLTFSVASQLSGPTYIVLTAVAGALLNFYIMRLRF